MRLLPILLILAACSSAGPVRYVAAVPEPAVRTAVNVSSLEVRDAVLPLYAELEEIYVEAEDGGLVSNTGVLWADDPARAVTQGLATSLAALTRAQVAAEPWPLQELPDARLEVRLDRMVAGADGQFAMSGQYFVSRDTGREDAGRFSVAVPYQPDSLPSIAAAKGRAIDALARQIAREALGARGV